MAQALPAALAERLTLALLRWREWRGLAARPPEPLRTLHAGTRNWSMLVSDGEHDFVVRLDRLNPADFGLDRRREAHLLGIAAAAGLAPPPCFTDPTLGVLVCRYLAADPQMPADPAAAGELLARLHRLPATGPALDLRAHWRRYRAAAVGVNLPPDPPAHLLNTRDARNDSIRFCHNDLLRGNRLRCNGQWYALDFEYAAAGDPLFDLAAIIEGDHLNEVDTEALLQAYHGTTAMAGHARRRLQDCRRLYRHTSQLWHAAEFTLAGDTAPPATANHENW